MGRVCERRKVKVNFGKSNVLRFSFSSERELLRVKLWAEELEEVSELKYQEYLLQVNVSMEGCNIDFQMGRGRGCCENNERVKYLVEEKSG